MENGNSCIWMPGAEVATINNASSQCKVTVVLV
jgi:hypothetical protein